jgi:hypothetical protein
MQYCFDLAVSPHLQKCEKLLALDLGRNSICGIHIKYIPLDILTEIDLIKSFANLLGDWTN